MPRWLPGLFLFLLACGVYAREPFNGFIWDDPQYVVDNPTLTSPTGLLDIWADPRATPQYYPAVHTTFWVEAHLWGTHDATGYHVDNVLLHAAAAVLLWRALVALAVPWPWLAAAVFAVHPVTVESVAWVTERKNVLSLTFYLLAFHAYRRTGLLPLDEKPRVYTRGSAGRWYAATVVLFLLALFSKTVTCSFPAALLLIAYWKRGRLTRGDVKPLLPLFAVGLGLAALTAHLERAHVGATGRDFDWLTPADRVLIAGRALWFYAAKIAWPARLLFMYPRWTIDPARPAQWLYPAAAAAAVAGLWLARRRLGRGPLVAVLFFAGTLTPALGFFNVYPMRYSWVADHFQYLAMIGLITLAVAVLDRLCTALPLAASRIGGRQSAKPQAAVTGRMTAAAAVLVPLAVLTWRQQAIYRDARTLWTDTLARNPTSWMAHVNLASADRADGREPAADDEIAQALRLDGDVADTHYSMGAVYARRGDWPRAVAEYRTAADLGPQIAACWGSLARVLWKHGAGPADQTAAVRDAERAVALDPGSADAQGVLSDYAAAVGDRPGAVAHAERAAAAEPANPLAHVRLGTALIRASRPADAAVEFRRAVDLDPTDAGSWTNLGSCALAVRRPNEAADAFGRALSIDPSFAPARAGLRRATGRP